MKHIEAQMLIRKPAAEVAEAFINPEITKHFWFTNSTGVLQPGATVIWTWEMYNVSSKVFVREVQPAKKIVIEWDDPATLVEFSFQSVAPSQTYVVIRHSGFQQTGDELIRTMMDSTGGFTTVLDGLKAYLEHGINLNLVADKFPKGVAQHGG